VKLAYATLKKMSLRMLVVLQVEQVLAIEVAALEGVLGAAVVMADGAHTETKGRLT
jgi:hypothetical protein